MRPILALWKSRTANVFARIAQADATNFVLTHAHAALVVWSRETKMAARWIGLTRPPKKKIVAKRGLAHTINECTHALGAAGVLVMAAAMNFALYPDALAAVVSGERQIVGFVPDEAGSTSIASTPVVLDEEDVRLLAATAWGEARSEGADGMRAVAHVMVNRVSSRFGEDLKTVILSPRQFSAWNVGDPNRPLVQNPERYATAGENLETWQEAQLIAREVLTGQSVDPTGGALFYHTRAIRPWWSSYGEGRTVIGAHVFYRDVPNQRSYRRARTPQIAENISAERGPRAGRVNGVIQYAPVSYEPEAPAASAAIDAAAPAPVGTAQASIATGSP